MAEQLKPIGFWSYARDDEKFSNLRLVGLHTQVYYQLAAVLGSRQQLTLFRDQEAINFGQVWENKIKQALADACFFIAIITPTYLQSPWCLYEVEAFLNRQDDLGRNDLVFGIRYLSVDEVNFKNPEECIDPSIWTRLCQYQAVDLSHLYHYEPTSFEVRQALDRLVKNIRSALRRGEVTQ